ncbi:MAG: hypothetical protein QGF46_07995, partial [Planctomycetota bacterium]|nr:hypothetical protein [Planctomycetota bacterium]
VKEHVIFILPLTSLSGNSLDRSSISVQAILTGFSNEEDLLFFQRNMVVRPLQPEDALVTVARLKQ